MEPMKISGVDRITPTSARLTVSAGYEDGRQKRHRKTVNIPKRVQGDSEKLRDWLVSERAKFQQQVDRHEVGDRKLTLEKWAHTWLEDFIQPHRKAKTCDEHEINLRLHILPELGKVKLENLTPARLQRWANGLSAKSNGRGGLLSPVTVNNVRRTLSACLETAVRQDLMPEDPVKKVQWPREDRRRENLPTLEQMRTLCAEIDREPLLWRALFTLALETGMRRGEVVGLDWSCVDLDQEAVHIRQSVVTTRAGVKRDTPKSMAGIRVNAIQPELCALLRDLKREQQKLSLHLGLGWSEERPVFANEETLARIHPDSATTRFKKVCARAGVEMRLHDLRHFFVSMGIHVGVPLTSIARQVGHAGPDTTARIYAQAINDPLAASRQLSERIQTALREAQ